MKYEFQNISNREREAPQPGGSRETRDQTHHDTQHDSLFGMMLFSCFCGDALEELAAEAMNIPQQGRELDVGKAVDLYEEIRRDRTNGGFVIGEKKVLNGMFNGFGGAEFPDREAAAPALPALTVSARGQGTYVTSPAPAA